MAPSPLAVSNHEPGIRTVAEKACYVAALAFLRTPLKRFGFRNPTITRFDSTESYLADRVANVSDYRQLFGPHVSFAGKTVLELGCNRGYLLRGFLELEKFTAIGADLSTDALDAGRKAYGDMIKFVESTPASIPLSPESVDIVYTIDTVEHLSQPKEIFMEVFRVLRPGGLCLIHFNPWLNPYGSHLEDIIPFPWPHVVFSMDTLLRVAAKLYESPSYPTACYWLDPTSGQKRPNPFLNHETWKTYLNHMTIRRFKRLLNELPFEILHQKRIGFGGKTFKFAKYLRALATLPAFDEFMTAALFTVLVKPGSSRMLDKISTT
jgi:SAM-dependent methyltransferase